MNEVLPQKLRLSSAHLAKPSVSSRDNARVLEHQDHGPLRRPRPVNYAFRYNESLARSEFNGAVFKIDEQLAFDYVEKLVVIVVFVPVIHAFDDSNSYHRSVHLAERLVVPLMRSCVGKRFFVDQLQRLMQNIQSSVVGKLRLGSH